jgi:pyruvate dehydrogenase E1 component alpha subunit
MRSTQDPIRGLQKYIEDWGFATQDELKAIDKDAKAEVENAVEGAKASLEPDTNDFWADIYYKGTEPPFMRGRKKEEVSDLSPPFSKFLTDDRFRRFTTFRSY